MQIKICGLTHFDDALMALEAGATHLGFNFYPNSPRYISPEACAAMISALRTTPYASRLVGLFVNASPATIAAILDDCGLDLAQIHSDHPAEQLRPVQGRFYKAFRGTADGKGFAEYAALSSNAPAVLVDAHVPGAYGGTGQLADWEAARSIAAHYPIFLAGGLTPENVVAAITQVRPWGVDVASGIESAPGQKDPAKMRAFIRNAKVGEEMANPSIAQSLNHPMNSL